ncbi:hypothetical protein OROHE_025405 [Orobanche hederae]
MPHKTIRLHQRSSHSGTTMKFNDIKGNLQLTLPSDIRKSVLRQRPIIALMSHFLHTMATMGPVTLRASWSKKTWVSACTTSFSIVCWIW